MRVGAFDFIEGQLTPPAKKRLYESALVSAIQKRMLLVNNLIDSDLIEIVNLKIPWRL